MVQTFEEEDVETCQARVFCKWGLHDGSQCGQKRKSKAGGKAEWRSWASTPDDALQQYSEHLIKWHEIPGEDAQKIVASDPVCHGEEGIILEVGCWRWMCGSNKFEWLTRECDIPPIWRSPKQVYRDEYQECRSVRMIIIENSQTQLRLRAQHSQEVVQDDRSAAKRESLLVGGGGERTSSASDVAMKQQPIEAKLRTKATSREEVRAFYKTGELVKKRTKDVGFQMRPKLPVEPKNVPEPETPEEPAVDALEREEYIGKLQEALDIVVQTTTKEEEQGESEDVEVIKTFCASAHTHCILHYSLITC